MDKYRSDVNNISKGLLETVVGVIPDDVDILKTYIEFSTLYEEVKILYKGNKRKGVFAKPNRVKMLKFDISNNCGALYEVLDSKGDMLNLIDTFGSKSILMTKGWSK